MRLISTNRKHRGRFSGTLLVRVVLSIMFFVVFLQGVEAVVWSNTTFNNSLSEEVLSFSGSALLNLEDGLIGYYTLNETSGDFVNSISTGLPNGTVNQITRNVDGIIGDGAGFALPADSSESRIVIADDPLMDTMTENLTLSIWYKTSTLPAAMILMGRDDDSANQNWRIYFSATSPLTLKFARWSGGGAVDVLSYQNVAVNDGTWNHVVVMKNDTGWSMYFDGVVVSTSSNTASVDTDTEEIYIGARGDNQREFNGTIDEVGIWNVSLNHTEIIDILYNAGAATTHSKAPDIIRWLSVPEGVVSVNGALNLSKNTTGDFTKNPSLDVGADGTIEWNIVGQFSDTNVRTDDLFTSITAFLSGCTIQNGFCLVPFVFHSDTSGVLRYFDLSFSNDGFLENSQTFENSTFDTSRESFQINITFDSDRYSDATATLIYDSNRITGTESGSGNERIFSAEKDIGVVSSGTNKTFYWEIAMTDTDGQALFNSTFNNQTINPSSLIQCGAGANAINYTTYDEDDRSLLVTDFDATFEWTLTEGSAITKNVSVSLSGANNYQFCINTNTTFFTNVDISLNADEFTKRIFGFSQQQFTNVTTHQSLYLLNESLGTNFILTLKDVGLFPLPDHTIKIFRKLESGGEILVENDVTDHIGQIVARVIENEVKYRILFFNEDDVLVKTIPNAIFTCTLTVCRQTFVVQKLTGAFDNFDDLEDHTFTLDFDNDTGTFTFVWVDNRGESQTHRLLVEKITFTNGTEVVLNQTSTSDSAVLSYTADTSRASYRVSAFRMVGTSEVRLDILNVGIGDSSSTFSFEGLYWSFILFMLMLLVGRFHPPTGVILYLFTVFMLGIFGIVFINPAIMIASLVIGVLFIWAWQ